MLDSTMKFCMGGDYANELICILRTWQYMESKPSSRGVRPCRKSCPVGSNTHKIWEKFLTGAQNVRQSAEGLSDILPGVPEIIFAITAMTQ